MPSEKIKVAGPFFNHEYDENTCKKDFAWSEAVALGKGLGGTGRAPGWRLV
jgi:hypothetical protein